MKKRTRFQLAVLAVVVSDALMSATARGHSQRADATPVALAELWTEPADLQQRNLFYGVGGPDDVPDPAAHYMFLSHKTTGFSEGYDVEDALGRKWNVKLGAEAQPEPVVSRLVWAVGFHQPPTYYLPHWALVQKGLLASEKAGRFRLDVPKVKKAGLWAWDQNPFVDTPPLKGLYVLMVMVDNWDLKTDNNEAYQLKSEQEGASRWFVVKELGASFGANRPLIHGTRNDLHGFEKEPFITAVKGNRVEFGHFHGAWKDQNITPADVLWISERLARLSPEQWKDAFRAGGYSESDSDRFIARLRQKVADGLALR